MNQTREDRGNLQSLEEKKNKKIYFWPKSGEVNINIEFSILELVSVTKFELKQTNLIFWTSISGLKQKK